MRKLSPEEAREIWPTWPDGLEKRIRPEDVVDLEQEGVYSEEEWAEALKSSDGPAGFP